MISDLLIGAKALGGFAGRDQVTEADPLLACIAIAVALVVFSRRQPAQPGPAPIPYAAVLSLPPGTLVTFTGT